MAAVSSAACYGCHALIAPLGLPFEHFDAWGDFRTEDNGFVVDASGGIPGTDVEVADAPELGEALAGQLALETEHCVARQVVAYSLGEPVALRSSIFDEPECFQRLNVDLAELRSASFVEWLVELVGSPIFLAEYPE